MFEKENPNPVWTTYTRASATQQKMTWKSNKRIAQASKRGIAFFASPTPTLCRNERRQLSHRRHTLEAILRSLSSCYPLLTETLQTSNKRISKKKRKRRNPTETTILVLKQRRHRLFHPCHFPSSSSKSAPGRSWSHGARGDVSVAIPG